MFGPAITTEVHHAYARARLHTNSTAELSSAIDALSFLRPTSPVARDSHACIFNDSKHAAKICMGMIQSRTNVLVGLTSQRLLQAQLRLRITMQHIYSHGQNVGNECADHAAALGSFGLIPNRTIHTRWVRSSSDSITVFDACGNLDEALQVLRNPRMTRMLAPHYIVTR